jgi:hypothetical protein
MLAGRVAKPIREKEKFVAIRASDFNKSQASVVSGVVRLSRNKSDNRKEQLEALTEVADGIWRTN